MTGNKVFVDTNIIVSAIIQGDLASSDADVQRGFYDDSTQLFGVLGKKPDRQIGITTKTVLEESFRVMSNRINDIVLGRMSTDPVKRRRLLDSATAIFNLCHHRMHTLLSTVAVESPASADVSRYRRKVAIMSEHIKRQYASKYSSPGRRAAEAKHRTGKLSPHWGSGLKREVQRIRRDEVALEGNQLRRFMKNYPNSADVQILSEAVAIKNRCESEGDKINLYIASYDMGFFSPVRYGAGRAMSDLVTGEIKSRFGITCDLPREIIKKIS